MKIKKNYKRRLRFYYSLFIAFTLILVVLLAFVARFSFKDFFIDFLKKDLSLRTKRVVQVIENHNQNINNILTDDACLITEKFSSLSFSFFNEHGKFVCGSSKEGVEYIEKNRIASGLVFNRPWLEDDYMFNVSDVEIDGKRIGLVKVRVPLSNIDEIIDSIALRISFLGILAVFIISLASFGLYKRLVLPLQSLEEAATKISEGDFDYKIEDSPVREISEVSFAMEQMGAKLKRLETIRKDFVANVSHELKTPVATIQGFVETLLEGAKDNKDDLDRFLSIISKQSLRLSNIIEDLLSLARLESGNSHDLNKEKIKISLIINSAIDICRSKLDDKNIKLEYEIEQDFDLIVNKSLLEQALINLIDNAINYSEANTKISIKQGFEKDIGRIEICDQGSGISTEHLGRVFERFYRIDKSRSRKQGGTGLGLSIVKHIVSLHEGEVSVESEVGVGTKFLINFPINNKT